MMVVLHASGICLASTDRKGPSSRQNYSEVEAINMCMSEAPPSMLEIGVLKRL